MSHLDVSMGKGRLISESSFSNWSHPQKMNEITILNFFSIYVLWKVEDSDFVHFFEDEIKLKIHSQIKLPLSLARKFIIKYFFSSFWVKIFKPPVLRVTITVSYNRVACSFKQLM